MPAVNRSRYDIYADIIDVLQFYNEAGISQIARRANLPIDRAKGLVEFMVARGLILKQENPKQRPSVVYIGTNRGYQYFELYKQLHHMVVEFTDDEMEFSIGFDMK